MSERVLPAKKGRDIDKVGTEAGKFVLCRGSRGYVAVQLPFSGLFWVMKQPPATIPCASASCSAVSCQDRFSAFQLRFPRETMYLYGTNRMNVTHLNLDIPKFNGADSDDYAVQQLVCSMISRGCNHVGTALNVASASSIQNQDRGTSQTVP